MKSGTAEHEQKGVTTPRSAARTLPVISRRPASISLVRSGVKKERTMPTPNTTSVSNIRTFGVSKRKNRAAAPSGLWSERPRREAVSHSATAARRQ